MVSHGVLVHFALLVSLVACRSSEPLARKTALQAHQATPRAVRGGGLVALETPADARLAAPASEVDDTLNARIDTKTAKRVRSRCPEIEESSGSPAEIEGLLAAVLQRFVKNASTLPDGALLPESGTVYIAEAIDDTKRVTAGALPSPGARTFVVKPEQELQEMATRTRTKIPYISFAGADVAGDCAAVDVGVTFARPPNPHELWMCCCSEDYLYERRGGMWIFIESAGGFCF